MNDFPYKLASEARKKNFKSARSKKPGKGSPNMNENSLSDRVEVAIAALEGIGDGTRNELHPVPENYSVAEKAKIIDDCVISVAKLSLWQDVLAEISLDEFDERMFFLEDLLNRRVQEASSIIMALQVVN
jgi:hypothetical protein